MYMELESKAKKAEPEYISSYQAFKEWIDTIQESELELFQKYHGAKRLLKAGLKEVYIDAPVKFFPGGQTGFVDACGQDDDRFTTLLCEAGFGEYARQELFELLGQSTNVDAIWIYPLFDKGREAFRRAAPPESRKKMRMEKGTLEHLEDFFEGALEALDLFESEARMMMLFAMLESPRDKRFLRGFVNPKLVYENLATLQRMHLIQEVSSGVFGLSKHGESLMREYLLFLDRVGRAIRGFEETRER